MTLVCSLALPEPLDFVDLTIPYERSNLIVFRKAGEPLSTLCIGGDDGKEVAKIFQAMYCRWRTETFAQCRFGAQRRP